MILLVATSVARKSWKARMDPGLNPREAEFFLSGSGHNDDKSAIGIILQSTMNVTI